MNNHQFRKNMAFPASYRFHSSTKCPVNKASYGKVSFITTLPGKQKPDNSIEHCYIRSDKKLELTDEYSKHNIYIKASGLESQPRKGI